MSRTYHHIGGEERAAIMLERQRGTSIREIAIRLGRSPSTISREVRRGAAAVSSAEAARAKALVATSDHALRRTLAGLSALPELPATILPLLEELNRHRQQVRDWIADCDQRIARQGRIERLACGLGYRRAWAVAGPSLTQGMDRSVACIIQELLYS